MSQGASWVPGRGAELVIKGDAPHRRSSGGGEERGGCGDRGQAGLGSVTARTRQVLNRVDRGRRAAVEGV